MIEKNEYQITSKDISLREFQLKDALAYFQLYTHPLVIKYIPLDMIPRNVNAAASQIKNLFLQGRPYPYWAIIRTDTDTLIGSCGFVNSEPYHKRIEIAYDLHPNYWGNGLMHASLLACAKYAFEVLHVQRLEAVTLTDNVESMKSLKRMGMTHEGLLRNFKYFKGKMVDVESFAMTPQDFAYIHKK